MTENSGLGNNRFYRPTLEELQESTKLGTFSEEWVVGPESTFGCLQ